MTILIRAGTLIKPRIVSASSMPTTNLPGWTLIFNDDFDYDFPVGSVTPNSAGNLVTGPAAATVGTKFTFYPDTWNTTHGDKVYPILPGEPGYLPDNPDGSPGAYWPPVRSKYYPSKVVSFSPTADDGTAVGVARIYQHSEVVGSTTYAMGATIKPKLPSGNYMIGPYGRWQFRMRSQKVIVDGVDRAAEGNFTTGTDNRFHWVPLGIDSNDWPGNGELDYPEGSTNRRVRGNYHPAATQNETWPISTASPVSPYLWHIYDVLWEPGRCRFILDGVVLKDTTDRVPDGPMAFLFQAESDWRQPPNGAVSTIEVDWCAIWDYTPGTP